MKTLFKNLATLIDKSGKILSRFKTIGAIIIIVFLIINNGCSKRSESRIIEQVAGLNSENNSLQSDIKKKQSALAFKDSIIVVYEKSIGQKEKEITDIKIAYAKLQKQKQQDVIDIINIPTDSSYNFLLTEAYPFPGELKYPFNEPQVKNIHLTFLEKLLFEKQNNNLLQQVDNYEGQLLLQNAKYSEKEKQYAILSENAGSYEKIIKNKDEEIVLKDKAIWKKDNRSLIWKVTVGVLIGILIIK